MNHKLDYQTILTLPVKMAVKHHYGLLNNVIHMDIPIKNTDDKITINIEIDNINSMEIKKMYAIKTNKKNIYYEY